MERLRRGILLIVVGLLPIHSFSADVRAAGSLDELLRNVAAAYGGEDALRKSSAERQTGKVTPLMRGGEPGSIVREFAYPGRLRVVIRYPMNTETRIYDGNTGWRDGTAVSGPPLQAMALQAARLALPRILLDRRTRLVDLGSSRYEGKEVRTVGLPLGGGLTLTADIDPATWRIVRSTGTGESAVGGRPFEFVTRYGDFRTVDGVLRPFREGNYAGGFAIGETVLDKVEILKGISPETFRP